MEGILRSHGELNMQLPDFLTAARDGEIRLAGHRIGLLHVVEHYNDGDSAEMLASRYTSLPLALVHKVIAFYLDNQAEVDAYITGCRTAMDQQQQAANAIDINALRLRLVLVER
jgi:uncharacterized protein (DUF433 family)